MSRRRAALKLLQKSIAVYKQIEVDIIDFDPLLRGFTGRPIFLERQQQRYRNELQRVTNRRMQRIASGGQQSIRPQLNRMVDELQNLAEREIPRGFRLGLGKRPLNEDDQRKIDIALESNRTFLQTSLAPAIEQRIVDAITEPDGDGESPTFEAAVAAATPFATNRSGLYAGAFWTLIWVGFSSALLDIFGNTGLEVVPVRRLLDPASDHCLTCPPKAGEYSSWEEMLSVTGGLPADGSDQCHSNCNCTIQALIGGSWVYVA